MIPLSVNIFGIPYMCAPNLRADTWVHPCNNYPVEGDLV